MIKNLLRAVIVFIFIVGFLMRGFSQIGVKTISVKSKTTSVLDICSFLQKQYNIKVAYGNNDPQLQQQVNITGGSYRLKDFLATNFSKNAIKYQLTDEQLIIIPFIKKQAQFTISGFVEDSETGEKLPGASVYVSSLQKGTTTNNYGFFTITLNDPVTDLLVSYAGYELYQSEAGFNEDTRITIKLKANKNLEEIIVTSTTAKSAPLQNQTQMSKVSVPTSMIKSMPRFLGEADLLKTIQLLPGVSQGSEGTSALLVRGGAPDQNLMLLDGTPVYNASHMFGIFSAFNSSALKSVDVYKGGFPARFGGRLSSVLDIVTKDGNMQEIHGEGDISLLAANLTLEGPLKKNKTSFLISGRRMYVDLIARPIIKSIDADVKEAAPYFYDVNVKLHHILSPKDRLFLSFYKGGDVLKFKASTEVPDDFSDYDIFVNWGNMIGALRWNHVFNKKLFANTTINYTQYQFRSKIFLLQPVNNNTSLTDIKYLSSINDISAKIDFDFRPLPEHSIKFGAAYINHTFTPNVLTVKLGDTQSPDIDTSFTNRKQYSPDLSVYGENDWKISPKLSVNAGFHVNAFKAEKKWYSSIQPRFGLRYILPADIAFKVAYTHMSQNIHLLANNSVTLPTDLWVPSTDKVKPMLSRQLAVGLAKSVGKNKIDISVEAFYKTMERVIEYKDGGSYLNSSNITWDSKVEAGKGIAYGVELLIQKNIGKTKGWIGYTYGRSYRVFPTINYGRPFDYKYDRRHDVEVAITQALGKRWEIAACWQFQTGTPITIPLFLYMGIDENYPPLPFSSNNSIDYVEGRNTFRLLNYHRLDMSITWKKKKRKHEKMWNLSIYNVYNRLNPFFYFFDEYNVNQTAALSGVGIFPIIPTITYGIKF